MIESGLLLFFLIPGLLSYCAFYGTFHSGRSIAPEPPAPGSVEIVTLILLSAAVVHVTSAAFIHINHIFVAKVGGILHLPAGLVDPYAAAFRAMGSQEASGDAIGGLVGIALMQGLIAYVIVRAYLRHLAKSDQLPAWIYGWAVDIANAADNEDEFVVAYVLTTHDHSDKTIVYGGVLYEMGLKSDGCITRIALWDCERYLADLSAGMNIKTLPSPSSRFPFMIIDASQIRNVAFEVVDLAADPES
ncbi:hypothetical protein [Sphingomonas sp.]|uniref:hypothetical protein n=1 Tax=Sphingomonas sp. TaxID=28214 RepID=UPI001EB1E818|nr:hypothetical protein [Sphingomonas sp.]MBX3592917.1 hypothetical protein [Sphingomonas sp.]